MQHLIQRPNRAPSSSEGLEDTQALDMASALEEDSKEAGASGDTHTDTTVEGEAGREVGATDDEIEQLYIFQKIGPLRS